MANDVREHILERYPPVSKRRRKGFLGWDLFTLEEIKYVEDMGYTILEQKRSPLGRGLWRCAVTC